MQSAIDHDAVDERRRQRVAMEYVKKNFNYLDCSTDIINAMALEIAKLTNLYEPRQLQTRKVEITGYDLFRHQLKKLALLTFNLRHRPDVVREYQMWEAFQEAVDDLHGVLSEDDVMMALSVLLLEALWPDDVPPPAD